MHKLVSRECEQERPGPVSRDQGRLGEQTRETSRGRPSGSTVDDDAHGVGGQQGEEGRYRFHGVPEMEGERVYDASCGVW